jgi:hypothetical protein
MNVSFVSKKIHKKLTTGSQQNWAISANFWQKSVWLTYLSGLHWMHLMKLKFDKQSYSKVSTTLSEWPSKPKQNTNFQDIDLTQLVQSKDSRRLQYYPGYRAAQQLGISSHLLSRITGTVFILRGPKEVDLEHATKVNIGLNLKVKSWAMDKVWRWGQNLCKWMPALKENSTTCSSCPYLNLRHQFFLCGSFVACFLWEHHHPEGLELSKLGIFEANLEKWDEISATFVLGPVL